jgi:hypothetical protein
MAQRLWVAQLVRVLNWNCWPVGSIPARGPIGC